MSDIKQINGKFYDFDPPNKSFLLTAKELKTMGIKNYYFMLRIDNPRVADIDPFKPNISKQEVEALMMECKSNMWFFGRTVVRLRTDAGIQPLCLHRGLAAAYWCFERHQDACLTEPRQTYKTTGTLACPIQWSFQFSKNLTMHFFGKETANTKKNLADLKSDIELLPQWMQFRKYMADGKIKNARGSTEVLENNLFHNQVAIHPKPSSLSHAQGLGRGGSGAVIYFDEIEHTPFFGELLSNSSPLFKTASENAAKIGGAYGRLFSSTPGNLDTREGRESYPIIKSMIPWTEKIYDMTDEEIEEYKSAYREEYHSGPEKSTREVVDIFYIEYQYYQLRKSYDWVLEQYKLSGDKMAIRREILMQRLRGSTDSPVDPEDIEYLISNMTKSTNDIIINNKWRFKLYEHGQGTEFGMPREFDKDIPYMVGIDPAAGGGGDNFAVTIVNPYNLRIAAEFKSPYMGQTASVQMLITLVNEYIPKAVLIVERNSIGRYLIETIVDKTSIRYNMYWSESLRQLENLVDESDEDYELKKLSIENRKYGTHVTQQVRKAMFELLFKHIAECKQLLNTEYLVDDICKLVRTSTGRIEAAKGEHDDSLFSYLHVLYVYYTGDNLLRFGIDKELHPVLPAVEEDLDEKLEELIPDGEFFSTENITFDDFAMQDAIRVEEEIKELTDRLSFVNDPIRSRNNGTSNKHDDTVDLPAHFFDLLN